MLPVIISGFPWVYIYSGAFLGILSLPVIWFSLYEYQKQRVLTLFNPEADIYGAGWNIVQSKIAVGSGGLFGKGFLNGSQSQLNFIPESHSDFIFSVIAEEFGFAGVCMLLFVYGILIFRLLLVAFRSTNRFAKIVSGTLSIVLLAYISINISMVIGILPVVGMPLPFLSQGGTALIVNLLTIGIILSLRKEV
jgi:rod shape determining protein RodA